MKKTAVMTGSVVVVAAAAAGYFLMRPTPTPETVKNPVDVQYEQLSIRLNELEAQVQQPDANVDSLFNIMDALRWKKGTDDKYEQQKFNLYIDMKKNVAMTFRKVIQERGLELSNPHLDDVESISQ